jgi:hypothetical protein
MTAHRDFSLEEMLNYLKDRCGDVSLVSVGSNWSLSYENGLGEQRSFEGSLLYVASQAFRPFYADALETRQQSIEEWGQVEKAVESAFSNPKSS